MNSSSNPRCKAKVPISDALIAYAGRQRSESAGEIRFLPVFEGRIDLGKIVSPLRAWLNVPSPLCAQVLMLLSLKSALWAEGYEESLSAVVYSKKTGKTSFNYSGIIRLDSTAIGQIKNSRFCGDLHREFRRMLRESWKKNKATSMARHAMAVAEWLMQPLPKTLGPLIGAQEFAVRSGLQTFFIVPTYVREVFEMTYSERKIDFEAVRGLARTVQEAIRKKATGKTPEEQRKHWHNEVVGLRNAPSKEAFRHRVLTLIEQGRGQGSWIEEFDPAAVLESMERTSFEEFRDCFRMYLIQASAPKRVAASEDVNDESETTTDEQDGEEEAEI